MFLCPGTPTWHKYCCRWWWKSTVFPRRTVCCGSWICRSSSWPSLLPKEWATHHHRCKSGFGEDSAWAFSQGESSCNDQPPPPLLPICWLNIHFAVPVHCTRNLFLIYCQKNVHYVIGFVMNGICIIGLDVNVALHANFYTFCISMHSCTEAFDLGVCLCCDNIYPV